MLTRLVSEMLVESTGLKRVNVIGSRQFAEKQQGGSVGDQLEEEPEFYRTLD